MLAQIFGPPDQWPDQDLIGFSDEFDAELCVAAYCSGVFPMPLTLADGDEAMGWWSPMNRGVMDPAAIHVTKSLRKSAKKYTTSVDEAFEQVIAACADPSRPYGWIDQRITDVYTELHHAGIVHSVETWDDDGRLVGGLYGVHIGGLFAGESMFHDPFHGRDASKVALVRLGEELTGSGVILLDVQWLTEHLASLGAWEIGRGEYLERLDAALAVGSQKGTHGA